jgi:hypothetical protein
MPVARAECLMRGMVSQALPEPTDLCSVRYAALQRPSPHPFLSPPRQAGEMAMLTTDDGTSNPYKVRTADGFDSDTWILLTSLVPADEAAAVRPPPRSASDGGATIAP